MPETPSDDLRELARSYGVQVEYVADERPDRAGVGRVAPGRAPGARRRGQVRKRCATGPRARSRRGQLWRRRVEPVVVAWDGENLAGRSKLRLPIRGLASSTVHCRLALEQGDESNEWMVDRRNRRSGVRPRRVRIAGRWT